MEKISVVIACYCSENTLENIVERIHHTLANSGYIFETILINDASPDNTYPVMLSCAKKFPNVICVDLSKNYGQHAALLAGYRLVSGDIIVGMDDDGQHAPEDMLKLVDKLNDGYDYVCAKHETQESSFVKSLGSRINNYTQQIMLKKPKDIVFSSYYAIKRFVVDEIAKSRNAYPYIGGLLLQVTNSFGVADVIIHKRTNGKSGYSFKKSLSLWLNGFTAFSVYPLRAASFLGITCSAVGFTVALITIVRKVIYPDIVVGWSSVMAGILLLSGVMMLILGLIGEYIGRIYINLTHAPQSVIREKVESSEKINNLL